MKLSLINTTYGIPQIEGLDAFHSYHGVGGTWYTTLEEARRDSLKWFLFEYQTFKRACPGKDHAMACIIRLVGGALNPKQEEFIRSMKETHPFSRFDESDFLRAENPE